MPLDGLSVVGEFEVFSEYGDESEVFYDGREAVSSQGSPWGWTDIT